MAERIIAGFMSATELSPEQLTSLAQDLARYFGADPLRTFARPVDPTILVARGYVKPGRPEQGPPISLRFGYEVVTVD